MARPEKSQVSTNLGQITINQIAALAAFYGVDTGEMRRLIMLAGTHQKMREYRESTGTPLEYEQPHDQP